MTQRNIKCRVGGKLAVVTSGTRVDLWSKEEVHKWLIASGFEKYAESLAFQHKIDGQALLLLTENDLRQPPVCIQVLGDVKKLGNAIEQLKMCQKNLVDSYSRSYDTLATSVHKSIEPSGTNGPEPFQRHSPTGNLINKVESPDTRVKSLIKLLIAAIYCMFALLLTAFVMVIVHDRVPDMKTYPPLPDLILDNLPLIPWAFQVCEVLACALSGIWFIVLFFHKHRTVVLRRMFSLTGTVFLLRCVTMLITSLSVPGIHSECVGRGNRNIFDKFRDARSIWSGMGMSLNGVRTCGDYMFSGHTTAVTLLNHFITEYTPEDWFFLHTATWVMSLFGIFFILAAHEHYSIDVFVAFYISSRLFLYYHSMAQHAPSAPRNDHRTRIWFPLLWFFESGSMGGRIPNEYSWPLPSLTEMKEKYFKAWIHVLDKLSQASHADSLKVNHNGGGKTANHTQKHGRRKASKVD